MSRREYEYHGLMATTWDLLRGDTSDWEDRFFYLDLIRQYGQPVLDVGCGTGRLILDYLSNGLDVDGVDNSPDMLAICREKAHHLGLRPNLYQQAMESLNLPRKYQTIIVPSSSFQLVTDVQLARQAMKRFHDHLLSGGVLVMPFMVIWEPGDPKHRDWKLLSEVTRPEDGTVVRRWAKDWVDVENQLEHTENRYEIMRDGKVIASETHRRSPATRWYTQNQATQHFRDVGLINIRVFKGFTDEPAAQTDTIFAVLGQKPRREKSSVTGTSE
jgi:ubiquinone/menaquinone biosynthesis C-methylase UbiE